MEAFEKLGLKEVAGLIGILGKNHDIDKIDKTEIIINDRKYYYSKNGDSLLIESEDGKALEVSVKSTETEGVDYQNRKVVYQKHEVDARYYLKENETIRIHNEIPLYGDYEAFENVQRHDLMRGLSYKYSDRYGKDIATFQSDVDRICLNGDNTIYEFTDNGITFGNKLVTLDGNNLLSISGEEAPSIHDIYSFDLEKERTKVGKILEDNQNLHPFTRELIEEAYRKLDRKERYAKNIESFYLKDIKNVRKAISIRNYLMHSIENELIPNEDLNLIEQRIRKDLLQKKLVMERK